MVALLGKWWVPHGPYPRGSKTHPWACHHCLLPTAYSLLRIHLTLGRPAFALAFPLAAFTLPLVGDRFVDLDLVAEHHRRVEDHFVAFLEPFLDFSDGLVAQ